MSVDPSLRHSRESGTPAFLRRKGSGTPAFAGVTGRLRRAGLVAGGVVGGLVALDLIGFLATAYFSTELLQYAQIAGVEALLPR